MNALHDGVSYERYAQIDALSGSEILNMRRSPMYYRHCLDNPAPETPAMKLGTATHRILLEPERMAETVTWGEREEEKVRRGKVWEAFQEEHADKFIITRAERDAIAGMVDGLYDSRLACKYLHPKGRTEVSMIWIDAATGRAMKGRPDKIIAGKGAAHKAFLVDGEDYADTHKVTDTILDLKTTRNCTPWKFGAQAYTLGYHIKAYLYCSGYKTVTGRDVNFKWLAVESKAPYECAVYRATPEVLLQGAEEFQKLIELLEECEESDIWPPASPDELDLKLPAYAFNQAPDTELFLEM